MITQKQYEDEQRKEKEFNRLFEAVIQKSPFGKFYPLMIGASKMLTKNLKKRIAIDKEGRPIVIYKSDFGKIGGVFANPTHQEMAKNLSKGNVKGFFQDLLGGSQVREIVKQYKKYDQVFDISPDEVSSLYKKKLAKENPEMKPLLDQAEKNSKTPAELKNDYKKENVKPVQKTKKRKTSFFQKLKNSFKKK